MQGGVWDAVLVQGGGEDVEHVGPRGEHQRLGGLVLGPDPQQTPAHTTLQGVISASRNADLRTASTLVEWLPRTSSSSSSSGCSGWVLT